MDMDISTYISKAEDMETIVDLPESAEKPNEQSSLASLQRPLRVWAAILFIMSLCLCAWGLTRSEENQTGEEVISRLSLALSRLMLADEIAVNDELQRAADSLEQVLAERDTFDPRLNDKDLFELFRMAGSIKDSLTKSDRKAAIEGLVAFKTLAAAVEAKFYQSNGKPSVIRLEVTVIIGLIGLLLSFGLLWWLMDGVQIRERTTLDEAKAVREELTNFKFRFEEEQRRNIELQQRLIDMGKGSKKMEAGLEEYTRAINQLETAVKYLKTSLSESESRIKMLEQELEQSVRLDMDRSSKISSLQAIIEASERSEAALQSKLQTLQAEKDEQYENFSTKLRSMSDRMESLQSHPEQVAIQNSPILLVPPSSSLPPDLARLESELIQEKTRIQSELAVIEWSNQKLKNELDEIRAELVSAKAALLDQDREARERYLALQEGFASEKTKAIQELTKEFEGEVKFLREQLRAANDRVVEKTA